jgi:hypothetical protein
MTVRQQYRLGLRVGRARARHGSPLPVLMSGAFMVGVHVGWREIEMGRVR